MFTDGTASRIRGKREVEITGAPLLIAAIAAICDSQTARETFDAMELPPNDGQLSGWLTVHCGQWIESDMERSFGTANCVVQPNRRLIVKLGSDEPPYALHPARVVMFTGDRWLAKRGLLPMSVAFEGEFGGY